MAEDRSSNPATSISFFSDFCTNKRIFLEVKLDRTLKLLLIFFQQLNMIFGNIFDLLIRLSVKRTAINIQTFEKVAKRYLF